MRLFACDFGAVLGGNVLSGLMWRSGSVCLDAAFRLSDVDSRRLTWGGVVTEQPHAVGVLLIAEDEHSVAHFQSPVGRRPPDEMSLVPVETEDDAAPNPLAAEIAEPLTILPTECTIPLLRAKDARPGDMVCPSCYRG
jgi:hypothetical protein